MTGYASRLIVTRRAAPAALLILALAVLVAACGGRQAAGRDVLAPLSPIPAHSVGDLVGRWESTVANAPWVWVVKDDGVVDWSDGRRRGTGKLATQAGRVVFTPVPGETHRFSLYLLPSHRLLLRSDRDVRMMLTQ